MKVRLIAKTNICDEQLKSELQNVEAEQLILYCARVSNPANQRCALGFTICSFVAVMEPRKSTKRSLWQFGRFSAKNSQSSGRPLDGRQKETHK